MRPKVEFEVTLLAARRAKEDRTELVPPFGEPPGHVAIVTVDENREFEARARRQMLEDTLRNLCRLPIAVEDPVEELSRLSVESGDVIGDPYKLPEAL